MFMITTSKKHSQNVRFQLPFQSVDATHALKRSPGVSNFNVSIRICYGRMTFSTSYKLANKRHPVVNCSLYYALVKLIAVRVGNEC
jgi:hypothetical protein